MKESLARERIGKRKSSWSEMIYEKHQRSFVWRYGVGLLCVLVAFGLRYALHPVLGSHAPFMLFVPPILIAAWIGGFGPSLVAALLAVFLTNYFFIAPVEHWTRPDEPQIVALATYVFSALVVVGLMKAVQRGRERLAGKANESARRMELLQEEIKRRRRVEDRLGAIMDSSPAAIFLKDIEGRYLLVNRHFEAITRQPSAAIIGKTDHEIFRPQEAEVYRANDLKVIEAGLPFEFEEIAIHDDGPHVSIVHKFPLRDSDGKVYAMSGIATDISGRKRTEEILRESEEKYRSLYRNTPVMMHSIDPSGTLISVSNRWSDILGYTRDEVLGRKSAEFMTPESQKYAKEVVLPEFFKSGICHDVPYQMVKKNGEIIDVLLSAIADKDAAGNITRSLAVLIDVTARKRAERDLRSSETKLRVLAETAVDAIISMDSEGNITQLNPAAGRIFGYSAEEILGKPVTVLMPFRFRQLPGIGIQQCLARARRHLIGKTRELVGMRKDGTEFPLELSLSNWETADGKFFTGIVRDITERKQAQEDLRQSEEMLRLTTEGASVGLWSWDVSKDSLNWNSVEYQQCALPPAKRMNLRGFLECVHSEDRAFVNQEMATALKENRKLDIEYRVVWPDGTIRWRHCKGSPSYLNGEPVRISGMSLDITRRKEAELALQEARNALAAHAELLEQRVVARTRDLQRSLKDMESFCYTIAHDLRAPLRAMSGFSQSLVQDYGTQIDATGRDYCNRINDAAARMSQLISDLLVYGRLTHSELPAGSINLETEINKILGRNAPEIKERRADIQVDKPLPHVCGDVPVFDQILENLILNAVKFMPPGKEPHLHIFAENHEGNVRLCVEDNGIGIPSEHLKKIFRPFERLHTTAYPGTGIGLAIVQKGIEKMGGHFGVESSLGEGSRFWVELPEQCDRLS